MHKTAGKIILKLTLFWICFRLLISISIFIWTSIFAIVEKYAITKFYSVKDQNVTTQLVTLLLLCQIQMKVSHRLIHVGYTGIVSAF